VIAINAAGCTAASSTVLNFDLAHMSGPAADVELHLDRPLDIPGVSGLRLRYHTIAELTLTLAGKLSSAGVRSGDRVAIIKRNHFDILLLAAACARIDACPVLIADRLEPELGLALLDRLDRPHLVVDAQANDRLLAVAANVALRGRIGVDDLGDGSPTLAELSCDPQPRAGAPDPAAPAIMTHSSGTTGVPKLVMHSRRTLAVHARWENRFARLLLRGEDRGAVCISLNHLQAVISAGTVMRAGVPLLILTDPSIESVATQLARFRPTLLETHPNLYALWEELAEDERRPLGDVRMFISTFDPVHPRTVRCLLDASQRSGAMWFQGYGQSEIGPASARVYLRRWLRPRGPMRSVGWAMPGITRTRVVDPDSGRRLPRGTRGQIAVRTRGRCETFYGQPDEFAARQRGRWWDTGDVGVKRLNGSLDFFDREVDLIDGFQSTIAVEDILLDRLPELTEVVLISLQDGTPAVPVLCTAGDHDLSADRWSEATADLPPLADPVRRPWRDLPHTATFKVRRGALREALIRELAVA
jgi:fatty acid CoA ligase FadD22